MSPWDERTVTPAGKGMLPRQSLALITVVAGLTAWAAFVLIPDWLGPHVLWATEAVGVAIEVGILVSWPIRRRKAGRIFLDLGRTGRRFPVVAVGAGTLAGVLVLVLAMSGLGLDPLEGAFLLLGALITLLETRAGAKVAEQGVLRFHGITPWRDLTVSWTRTDGFVAERMRPRRLAWYHVALFAAATGSAAALHAWLLPEGVTVSDAVRVRFIPDDRYGSPTLEFVRSPGERVRAVIERRRFDGTSSRFAEFELGDVAARDTLTVWWQGATDSTDPERPFRLTLVHGGVSHEQAITHPFPTEEQLILPVGTDHPIDEYGAIVISYTGSYVAREADTIPINPSDWRSWLVLLFERVE